MDHLTDKILSNLNNLPELGRQRAFELGNPYYYQVFGDDQYWRKEMPTGEVFQVLFNVEYNEKGLPLRIIDTFQKRIH